MLEEKEKKGSEEAELSTSARATPIEEESEKGEEEELLTRSSIYVNNTTSASGHTDECHLIWNAQLQWTLGKVAGRAWDT